MKKAESLIKAHGGYRNLKSFQMAQLVFDITVRFCDKYIDKFSRTKVQMVQAARSGVQNIAEGSQVSATSKKAELKLTQVARASLEELKLDYEDFLRQNGFKKWQRENLYRQSLIDRRCQNADEVAQWVLDICKSQNAKSKLTTNNYAEYSANAVLVLLTVACTLLDRQVKSLADAFEEDGGFTERLYRVRNNKKFK